MADWITLGVDEMAAAQKALGLSDERLAREVAISTRTWIRWRQRGQVPVYMLDRVAAALDLEIERPARRSISLPDEAASIDDVLAAITALGPRLDRIEAALNLAAIDPAEEAQASAAEAQAAEGHASRATRAERGRREQATG